MMLSALSLCAGCDSKTGQNAAAKGGSDRGEGSVPTHCSREPVASEMLRIGVIPMGSTHEFWKAIHAGVRKAELELTGVQVEWKAPIRENDREYQINLVENFINAGVDGIALVPADNEALLRPVRDAVKAGISVLILDSELNGTLCEDYASFVATNSYVGGQKAAHRMGEILGEAGSVLILRVQVGLVGSTRREQGFLDTIRTEYPEIMVVSSDQYGGTSAEEAYEKAESLLEKFPAVEGVFCPNESTTFGMLRALQGSGRAGRVKFVGFDSSVKLVAALHAGELHGLVLQDPIAIGYLSVTTLVDYLRGKDVPTRVDTGCEVATPENMNDPRIKLLLSPPIDEYL